MYAVKWVSGSVEHYYKPYKKTRDEATQYARSLSAKQREAKGGNNRGVFSVVYVAQKDGV